jgi:hypothetical protein
VVGAAVLVVVSSTGSVEVVVSAVVVVVASLVVVVSALSPLHDAVTSASALSIRSMRRIVSPAVGLTRR